MMSDVLISVGSKLIDKFLKTDVDKKAAEKELFAMIRSGELKELELLIEDRKSARLREAATNDQANIRIAMLILLGFFSTLSVLCFVPIEAAMKDTLLLMIGSLGIMATQVVAYYFGSSSGSSFKTKILSKE